MLILRMDKPKICFSPPAPFSSKGLDELFERLAAIERELMLLKKRVKQIEERTRKDEDYKSEPEGPFFLETIDAGSMRVIDLLIDWISFLLSKVGREGLDDVLSYYVSVKWISPEVADLLKKYADGLRIEASQGYLLPEDHVKSLDYISRIREAMV